MSSRRIQKHPILPAIEKRNFTFYWQDQPLTAHEGETIASALIANNIHIFGHHPRDGSPLGIFVQMGNAPNVW